MNRFPMALVSAVLLVLSLCAKGAGMDPPPAAAPLPVSQGQFAALLHSCLEQAGDEEGFRVWQESQANADFTPREIARAVETLTADGLIPHAGWRPAEALRRHDVTSLLARAYNAGDGVDLADPEACLEFVESQGGDVSTISRAVRCAWIQKRSANKDAEPPGEPLPKPAAHLP